MSKNRKNKPKASQHSPINIVLPEHMSAEEMQHIIANAIVEADNIKKQQEIEQKQEEKTEWMKALGYYDHSADAPCKSKIINSIIRKLLQMCNTIKRAFNLIFVSADAIKGTRTTFILLKAVISDFFSFMKWIFESCAVLLAATILFQEFNPRNDAPLSWGMCVIGFIVAFVTYYISRLFRIASIEADKLEDQNYILGLFASITSIVSIVIAIIAIVRGG